MDHVVILRPTARRKLLRQLILGTLLAASAAVTVGFLWESGWHVADRADLPSGAAVLNARVERRIIGHSAPVEKVAFSPDGKLLASASVDATVRLWSIDGGNMVRSLALPAPARAVVFMPDGASLATGNDDGLVQIWRVSDGALISTLSGHEGTVWAMAASPDGAWLASAGADKNVILWKAADGARVRTLTGHTRNIWTVAFSPDSRAVASGSFDSTVRIWSVAGDQPSRALTQHSQAVVALGFSPDGALLATAGDDTTLKLWRPATGELIRSVSGGPQHIYALAFTPDGKYLATGGRGRSGFGELLEKIFGARFLPAPSTIRLWRVSDGALLQTLHEPRADIHGLQFSPDGHQLASAGTDGNIILWRIGD